MPTIVKGLGTAHFAVLMLFLTSLVLLTSLGFGLSSGGVRSLGAALHTEGLPILREIVRELWSVYFILGISAGCILLLFRQTLWEMLGLEVMLASVVGSYALLISVFFGFCSLACTAVFRATESFLSLTVIQVFLVRSVGWGWLFAPGLAGDWIELCCGGRRWVRFPFSHWLGGLVTLSVG